MKSQILPKPGSKNQWHSAGFVISSSYYHRQDGATFLEIFLGIPSMTSSLVNGFDALGQCLLLCRVDEKVCFLQA